MTKILADLLGARGPEFTLELQQLERAAGRPNHDIRLAMAVQNQMREKLHLLGLDRHDTTGEELYAALRARVIADEKRLTAALKGLSSTNDDPLVHIVAALEKEVGSHSSFALKNSSAKKLLKANLPKKTMKALGYRSADSMLKHESVANVYAAAWMIENEVWRKRIIGSYAKLTSVDFEARALHIEHPVSSRWKSLAETVVAFKKQHVLTFKELGTVVVLPLPADRPALSLLPTAVMVLHGMNDTLAASTFLKLQQLKPHFGNAVQQIVKGEPELPVGPLDIPVQWHMVQRYYARMNEALRAHVFEPVLQAEDIVWHSAAAVLSRIEPSLEFWEGTDSLAHRDGLNIVSCNLTDAVLSHTNDLPYSKRLGLYFRQSLHSELMLRYLDGTKLERALGGELALEPVRAN